MADVLGSRKVFLSGCFLYATFTLCSGLSRTPLQLILFRAMQGLSIAACLPSAVGILSLSFPTGPTRNLGFAVLGAGQPVGFASGMVLSGVFISKLSWRWAFYCSAIVNLGVFLAAWWGLPQGRVFEPVTVRTFWRRVDWVGAGLVSTSLGMFFYVLAYGPFPLSPSQILPPNPRHGRFWLVVIQTQALFVLALLAVRN
jgi:MFS family permease